MRRRTTIIVWMVLFAAKMLHAACECPPATQQEQLEAATMAFSGNISEIEIEKSTRKKTFVFDVVDTFKGNPPSEVRVIDGMANSPCDMEFTTGRDYLVYARWEWGKMVTARCYGSKVLEKAVKDVKQLGPADAAKEKQYNEMKKFCMGHRETPCCLASVKAMRAGYYLLEPPTGCPDGFAPDRLRCAGSHVWCVPIYEMKERKP